MSSPEASNQPLMFQSLFLHGSTGEIAEESTMSKIDIIVKSALSSTEKMLPSGRNRRARFEYKRVQKMVEPQNDPITRSFAIFVEQSGDESDMKMFTKGHRCEIHIPLSVIAKLPNTDDYQLFSSVELSTFEMLKEKFLGEIIFLVGNNNADNSMEIVTGQKPESSETNRICNLATSVEIIGSPGFSYRIIFPTKENLYKKSMTAPKIEHTERDIQKYGKENDGEFSKTFHSYIEIIDELKKDASSTEQMVMYMVIKGDYFSCLSGKTTENRKSVIDNCLASYEEGINLARKKLKPVHPIALGAAINYSSFLHDLACRPKEAIEVAKKALEMATAKMHQLDNTTYKNDSVTMMKVLKDNIELWTSKEKNDNRQF